MLSGATAHKRRPVTGFSHRHVFSFATTTPFFHERHDCIHFECVHSKSAHTSGRPLFMLVAQRQHMCFFGLAAAGYTSRVQGKLCIPSAGRPTVDLLVDFKPLAPHPATSEPPVRTHPCPSC